MTIAASPPGLQPERLRPDEYDRIETAVMETGRGRLFLSEHARLAHNAESARLLAAIERLAARLEAQQAPEAAARAARVTSGALEPPPADQRCDARLAALSWLDRLPLVDRFALFA